MSGYFGKRKPRLFGWIKYILLIVGIVSVICLQLEKMNQFQKILYIVENALSEKEDFRQLHINNKALDRIAVYSQKHHKDGIQLLTVNILWNKFKLEDDKNLIYRTDKIKGIEKLLKSKVYLQIYEKYYGIFQDVKFFPVASDGTETATVTFENSWNMPRTYGGKRTHEGTDIMGSNNVRGYFPIVSVSDGVIEQKGWLEKGGYRIGIRSNSGIYFYYAHLASYAENLDIGNEIKAGDVLGYMGDTGYSKVEGTTGKFDVHLHFGIYMDENGAEQSLNPYWILKYAENRKLKFTPHSN